MTFGKNTGGWIFDEVTPQYSVSLVSLQKTLPAENSVIPLRGPYNSLSSYKNGLFEDPTLIPLNVIIEGSDAATILRSPSLILIMLYQRWHK